MSNLKQTAELMDSPAFSDYEYVRTSKDSLIKGLSNYELVELRGVLQRGSAKICKGTNESPCRESTVYEVSPNAREALNNLYKIIEKLK